MYSTWIFAFLQRFEVKILLEKRQKTIRVFDPLQMAQNYIFLNSHTFPSLFSLVRVVWPQLFSLDTGPLGSCEIWIRKMWNHFDWKNLKDSLKFSDIFANFEVIAKRKKNKKYVLFLKQIYGSCWKETCFGSWWDFKKKRCVWLSFFDWRIVWSWSQRMF